MQHGYRTYGSQQPVEESTGQRTFSSVGSCGSGTATGHDSLSLGDAPIADENPTGPGNQLLDLALSLSAERAPELSRPENHLSRTRFITGSHITFLLGGAAERVVGPRIDEGSFAGALEESKSFVVLPGKRSTHLLTSI